MRSNKKRKVHLRTLTYLRLALPLGRRNSSYAIAPASAPSSSLAVPPPAESTAEAVDLSAGAVILEDQGTAAATASSTHQFFILPSLRSVYCSCFFSFWPYFEGIFVCTYSYVGFGPSPTHRFSLFVDLTMFNGSGGVQGALPRLRRRGINVGVAPLFSFFFFVVR